MYDLSASGHLEKGELIEDAIIREANEEIKVVINSEDLILSSVVHDISPTIAYINFNFICEKYEGSIQIGEPNKCDNILWRDINNLPENIMPERKRAIDNYIQNISFIENIVVYEKSFK
jgi:ADP-ribose pyrophosphatase YjhB (NUDIX family)